MFSNKKSKSLSYRSSGVDFDRAEKALDLIKGSITSTFSKYVISDLSTFCGLFELTRKDFKDVILASSTDGVGTKLLIAKEMKSYKGIGQDLVAMCVNDILCCGAKPLFFLDYIACGKINPEKIQVIIESISESCKKCDIPLIGGETAEMPDMYKSDDIDVAGFVVGAVERKKIISRNLVKKNDLIVGISSSGVHSNGFSLIRKIIKDFNLDLRKAYDNLGAEGACLGDILLTPTKIYNKFVGKTLEKIQVHGIAHITGGGFYDNIKRIIPKSLDAKINKDSWEVLSIFKFIKKIGNMDDKEMYRVFNMGIGMVLIISPSDFQKLKDVAEKTNENISIIGSVVSGSGNVLISGIDY